MVEIIMDRFYLNVIPRHKAQAEYDKQVREYSRFPVKDKPVKVKGK
tara:strand:+ start:1476 stop:1613 length:138 start_codon:yes stop_codon:yes gene_type:complete